MNILRKRGLVVAVSAVALAGCGGGSDGPPAPVKVATVLVTAPATQLEVGSTVLFGVTLRDSRGNALTGRPVVWSSSSPTVATVDGGGIVTGVGAGQATITATVEGVTGSAQITVIPMPVAAVLISPRTPSVRQGETTQLTAIAQDAIGRTLTDRPIAWSSQNPATATIAASGLVTGVSSGSTFIIATAEGKRDSVSLRVRSLNAPTVSTTTPAQWSPGTAATITGTNFSPVPTENEVLVNGIRAPVAASTATTISFTVPSATQLPCSPTGPVPITVIVHGDSASGTAALRVATGRALAVGEHLLMTSSGDLSCNEFSSTGGKYLVTAFNASTSASSRTSFQLLGAAAASASVQASVAMLPAPSRPMVGPLAGAQTLTSDEGFARGHLAALQENVKLMARNADMRRALLDRRTRARQGLRNVSPSAREVFAGLAPTTARTAPVPPPNVGDMLWKRMPRTFGNYNTYDSVRVRVVYVGPKLIIMEDSTNEMFKAMDAEYQAVGTEFDRDMWGFLSNFGDPLALDSLTDNNARVIALFTKRVNEYTIGSGGSLLGYVTLCDFFAQSDPDPANVCVPSNEGEYFYAMTVNPNGTRGKYDLAQWKRYARGTMIHELKHVVMFVQRIVLDASFTEETWLEEATAQIATELWARKIYGNLAQRTDIRYADGPRCDYATVTATCTDPVEAILHPFQFLYTHYNANETKSIINNSDVVIYGSSWSFARWATDQYDGGNEPQFLQRLVQQRDDRGITNVVNRTGRTWPELFGLFSMASTADNYPGGTISDPRLRLPSWNTRDVFAGMNANLVFRNPDGSTTPAFPRAWPLNVRTPSFGNFPDFVRTVSSLAGGSFVAWEITGTQTAPQVLAIRTLNGGPPPTGIGMVVLRVQ
ncbi:MAG: Ig-like domain-containing protein [Gemmatimonadaceae bacterium]